MKKSAFILASATLAAMFLLGPAHAQQKPDDHSAHHPAAAEAAAILADGEIRRIDREAKKITIKHGEIKNLDMPPMTMVFQVADLALVTNIKPGDKVKFAAEKLSSGYHVTQIHLVK